jgi:hypothetical protein
MCRGFVVGMVSGMRNGAGIDQAVEDQQTQDKRGGEEAGACGFQIRRLDSSHGFAWSMW